MADYKIVYNHNSYETIIEKNGKVLSESRLSNGINGKRLQAWFDECDGWKGFAEELFRNNKGTVCNIKFVGREVDYNDLDEGLKRYAKECTKTEFRITFEDCQIDLDDIFRRLNDLVEDLNKKDLLNEKQIAEIEDKIKKFREDIFGTERDEYPIKISNIVRDILLTIDEKAMRAGFNKLFYADESKLENARRQMEEINSQKEKNLAKKMKLEEKAQGYKEFYPVIESTRKSLKEQINVVIDGASRRMIPTHEEKNFIEREAAQQICNALENKVKNIMENEEKEVEKIYVDVEKLRNEFNEYTGHVNETLQSDSPDFTILKESLKYRFKGMHDHAYEVKAIPHTQELVKRKRVVHKHFGPDKTEYYDDVQDRIEAVYVDADRLEKDMFGIRDYILEKIDSIMENVDKEVESYKNWFSQELEKVSKIVDKTESELEVLTYQETNAIQQKKDHQKKLDEFNSIIDGINKILKN